MTDDEKDLESLREHAALLRSDVDVARLVAGVVERIRATPVTVSGWLSSWLRVVVAAAVAMALITGTVLYFDKPEPDDLMAAMEAQMAAEAARGLR